MRLVLTSLALALTLTAAQAGQFQTQTDQIEDQAVTTPKIADKAVTAAKIADHTVGATQLAPDAVIAGLGITFGAGVDTAMGYAVNTAHGLVVLDPSGYLGVGTSTPHQPLEVNGLIRSGGGLEQAGYAGAMQIGTRDAHALQLYTNNSVAMTIATNGYLGIGNSVSNPGSPLSFGTAIVGSDGEANVIRLYDTGSATTSYGFGMSGGTLDIVSGFQTRHWDNGVDVLDEVSNGVISNVPFSAPSLNGPLGTPGVAATNLGQLSLSSYGAVCNGVVGSKTLSTTGGTPTDNTTAMNNWLAAAAAGKALVTPGGVCNFTGTLHLANGVNVGSFSIKGQSGATTIFQYTGSDTTVDLLDIGSGTLNDGTAIGPVDISGIRITSATQMTAGWGVHIWHLIRSRVDIVVDGQDGTGNLFNGVWFDEDDVVDFPTVMVRAQNEQIRINGSRKTESWWPNYVGEVKLGKGKAGSELLNTVGNHSIGLHLAGGVGAVTCDVVDIIGNQYNLLVDQAVTGTGNQSFYGGNCMLDTPENGGTSAVIDDAGSPNEWQGGTKQIVLPMWVAGAPGLKAVNVKHFTGGFVNVNGVAGGGTYGILDDDPGATIEIASSASIYNNTVAGVSSSIVPPKIIANNPTMYGNGVDFDVDALTSSLGMYYQGGACNVGYAIGGSATGITYATNEHQCAWQLNGFDVNVDLSLTLTSKGSNTGGVTLTGLPATVSNNFSGGSGTPHYYLNWAGLSGPVVLSPGPNSTIANVYQFGGPTGEALVTDANLTNTTIMHGRVTYHRAP